MLLNSLLILATIILISSDVNVANSLRSPLERLVIDGQRVDLKAVAEQSTVQTAG